RARRHRSRGNRLRRSPPLRGGACPPRLTRRGGLPPPDTQQRAIASLCLEGATLPALYLLGRRAGTQALERRSDPLHALGGLVGRHRSEGEAQAALAAVEHEVGAGYKGDAVVLRLGKEGGAVGALGE